MKIGKFKEMKLGYFVGNFEPSFHKTESFEVAYKIHRKGEDWPRHYQRTATEVNLLLRGRIEFETEKGWFMVRKGDLFSFEPGEWCKPTFMSKKCEVIVVKFPSNPEDKVIF